MVQAKSDDACVTLAGCGDIGTGHTPPESAFTHVAAALREADLRFAQCEKLYSDKKNYQVHSGAAKLEALKKPETAAAFKSVPFDVLSLASNHIGDWGPEAVIGTVETFQKLGIPTIGAGANIAEARKPVILEKNGLKIGFLGYCSVLLPQFWATEERAGAAPMRAYTFYEPYEYQPGSPARVITTPDKDDLEALVEDIKKLKPQVDIVVMSIHWGLHYVNQPQDYQTIVARAAIEAGANVILGHHAHQPHGIELYKGALIFYSIGNFVFHRRGGGPAPCMPGEKYTHKQIYSLDPDPGVHLDYRRHWQESGIPYLTFDRSGLREATYLPTFLDEDGKPAILQPDDPQFETSRVYLEWLAKDLKDGVKNIPARDGQYILYERKS